MRRRFKNGGVEGIKRGLESIKNNAISLQRTSFKSSLPREASVGCARSLVLLLEFVVNARTIQITHQRCSGGVVTPPATALVSRFSKS